MYSESEEDFEANGDNALATDRGSNLNSNDCEDPSTDYDETLDNDGFDFKESVSDSDHLASSPTQNDVGTDGSDVFDDEWSDLWSNVSDSDSWSDHSNDAHLYTESIEEPNDFVNGGDEPIYEGADLTHNQSLVLLMSFVLKHQLTDQALGDFLTIMNMHLPNVVPETKYLFYKKFNHQRFVRHYFCDECFFYFGPNNKCGEDEVCSCHVPKNLESAKISKSYFSYWSLQSQLELILQDDSIAESLLNQPAKDHNDNRYITDATDGQLYKNLKEAHGYGQKDISLLWNADGVPVFQYGYVFFV